VLESGRLEGSVMIDGEAVPFASELTDGSFDFPVSVKGSDGRITGQVTGSTASGTYAFGSREGTWSGEIETTSPGPP
jgi:hypothetical protein